MNTADLIYQEARDLPETEAREVLDFVTFLKAKQQRLVSAATHSQDAESSETKADMNEFDSFGSVYDGNFDRDACHDRFDIR